MDYEKEYKDAMERAKKWGLTHKLCIEDIFPELAESEDERIRRIIMKFVWGYTNTPHSIINGDKSTLEYAKEVEAYLEKQEKEADERLERVEQFRKEVQELGEEMASLRKKIYGDERIEPHYTKRNALFDKCVENCDPEVMKSVSDEVDEMLEREQKPAEWSDYKDKVNVPYCSSEPEWSEEDEKQIRQIERIVKDAGGSVKLQEQIHNWFESLRPSWKPSEEQPKMNIPSVRSGAMGTTTPKFKLDVKQDLPVGLEKEIQEYLEKLGGGHGGFVDNLIDDDLIGLALHFYKLGRFNTRKEK